MICSSCSTTSRRWRTLAFLVAVMNRLLTRPALAERKPEHPRALILAPTHELAIQIHKDAVKFGSDLGLKFALVYGGVDYDKQREILQKGADVIIATPGRLIDYVKQHKVVSLHACEMCVLDEADRMFDLGFIKDIRFLLRRVPDARRRAGLEARPLRRCHRSTPADHSFALPRRPCGVLARRGGGERPLLVAPPASPPLGRG